LVQPRHVWTTGTGQHIPVNRMTDSHLVNTIQYLQRSAASRLSDELVCAAVGADEHIYDLIECTFIDFVPSIYHAMVGEARRRELMFMKKPVMPVPPYMMEEEADGDGEQVPVVLPNGRRGWTQ